MPIDNVLSAKGLQTTPNNLGAGSVGALVEAANVMIRYPDVIEPRRGQQFYAEIALPAAGNIDQLMLFEDTVVVHTENGRIYSYDGDTTMKIESASVYPARDDQRLKWAVSAQNLHLCTTNGVQVFESIAVSSVEKRPSGLPFPTQPFVELYTSSTGSENWLTTGNAVSYRVVFGYIDVHDRLYLGPPSPFSIQVRNDSGSDKAVRLRIDTTNLPQISTGDLFPRLFLQVYRTAAFAFATAEPNEEFYLVTERFFQPDETVFVTINDTSPTNTLGAKLYTNPTAEGDGQQNNAPPFARDIASWDDRLWYANTEQPQSATLQIVGVGATGVQVGDKLRIANLDDTQVIEMEAVSGAPTALNQFVLVTSGTGPQNIDGTTQSLVWNIDDYFLTGSAPVLPPCRAFLVPGSATSPTTMFLQKADGVQGDRQQFTLSLIPTPLPFTAVVNPPQVTIVSATDAGYAPGDTIYLTSGALKETRTILTPGAGLNVWNLSGGALPAAFATGTTTRSPFLASRAWNPQLPIYGFEELDVTSSDDRSERRLYYSKAQLPEGVPLLNYIDVGTSGKEILRIWPNRNRLIVFKEEGTYVVYGEYGSYAVQLLDDTVQLLAPDSIASVGSTVFALVDDGVVAINESSLFPVSEVINAQLAPYLGTLGRTQIQTAFGVAHETDQMYSLWAPGVLTIPRTVYVYGIRSQSWTTWGLAGACGRVNPTNDTLYWAGADSRSVFAEAHESRRSDYVDKNAAGVEFPIECRVTYASTTFGNPSATKQAREIHAHFRQAAFQTGSFTLTTDISTSNSASVPVAPGSVYNVTTNNPFIGPPVAPVQFRKLIPQEHQRATYYNWTWSTNEAYAYWALNGISTVFETTSERTGTVR